VEGPQLASSITCGDGRPKNARIALWGALGHSLPKVPETTMVAANPRESARSSRPDRDLEVPAIIPLAASNSSRRAGVLQAGGHRFDPGWLHHFDEGQTPVSRRPGFRRLLGRRTGAAACGGSTGCLMPPCHR
jgi:hypothetical protein